MITTQQLKKEPQAIDLEEVVLGAVLIDKEALVDILEILRPEMFHADANRLVYEAILTLSLENKPIDLLTVSQALKASGNADKVGGAYYLTQLADRVVSAANIEYHARIISEMYIKRELIRNASGVVSRCYDDSTDVFELLSEMNMNLDAATEKIVSKKEVSNAALLEETMGKIKVEAENKGLVGIPSGLGLIDGVTGGWQPTDLVIIAARPGMGKTSIAISMAINAAKNGHPVGFFSLEMSSSQIMKKVISIEAKVPFSSLRHAKLSAEDWSQIQYMAGYIANMPIFWDDTPGMTITEIVAKAKRMKRKHGIEMIVVDYLQFIGSSSRSKHQTRDQEVGYFSRTLKNLAKELDVPVIALAQLSRAAESRPDKRPLLSDLRESGSIEQDADIVNFLYRPEYYGIETNEVGESTDGLAEFIIAKHRNGRCDKVIVEFNKRTTGFINRIDLL